MPDTLSRRQVFGLGAKLAAGLAAGGVAGRVGQPVPARAAVGPVPVRGRTDPVSMAMHMHACFSEGFASMHTHLDQAERNGVDVIWWTEHDFRVNAHGYRHAVRFDAMTEIEDELEWIWHESQLGPVTNAAGTFVDEPHSPHEDGKALSLTATGPAEEWGQLQYEGEAWNSTYSTSMADTTLLLDVLADSVGADAELVVEILSSYRPAVGARPAGQYVLQYRLGADDGRFTEGDGLLGVVASRARPGWQRLELRPVDDIAALWPDLVAGDASLYRLRVSVRARRGATATAVVDRLRFQRDQRTIAKALQLQVDLMAAYAAKYPGVRQHQGAELSLVRHLNRFGGEAFLPHYGSGPPFKDDSVASALAMVQRVHRAGGLASYNHPLGAGVDYRELARELVDTYNLGADLIEVGSGKVDDLAYAYDAAARNGVYVTASGVSDDHSGDDWMGRDRRWITSAWAASTEAPELVDALSAGRAWFADPLAWRGAMDIAAQGRPSMGGVLVTPDRRVPFEVTATDLPAGSTLELVTGEADFAGVDAAEPAVTVERIRAAQVRGGTVRRDVEPGDGRYLRAAVRDGDGALIGFANPTWVFPRTPRGGVPPQRALQAG